MPRKINLLYVITKLELGGAQQQLLSLIRHIDKSRCNLFLFTAQGGWLMEDALSIGGLTLSRSRYLERPVNPWKDTLAVFEIAGFIKKNKIDIVHTHSSKAGILGRLAATLAKATIIIHTVHGWSFNDFQRPWVRSLYAWLEKIAAKVTEKIVVVSVHDRQKGLVCGIGREDQYYLIRYGIDRGQFYEKDARARRSFGIGETEVVVGTISCFKPQKALDDFVRLADLISRICPKVKFLIVGDGVLRAKIEAMISRLKLAPRFLLTGWRRDIPEILSAMDVFVLTSLWEGLPVSILEAMSAGLPVVATHTGGIADVIVEGETGFLVPCKDSVSMLKKILPLLEDPRLRDRIGRNARARIGEEFSTENMARITENLYFRLAEERGILNAD